MVLELVFAEGGGVVVLKEERRGRGARLWETDEECASRGRYSPSPGSKNRCSRGLLSVVLREGGWTNGGEGRAKFLRERGAAESWGSGGNLGSWDGGENEDSRSEERGEAEEGLVEEQEPVEIAYRRGLEVERGRV